MAAEVKGAVNPHRARNADPSLAAPPQCTARFDFARKRELAADPDRLGKPTLSSVEVAANARITQ
jgi:hypothetical protein